MPKGNICKIFNIEKNPIHFILLILICLKRLSLRIYQLSFGNISTFLFLLGTLPFYFSKTIEAAVENDRGIFHWFQLKCHKNNKFFKTFQTSQWRWRQVLQSTVKTSQQSLSPCLQVNWRTAYDFLHRFHWQWLSLFVLLKIKYQAI